MRIGNDHSFVEFEVEEVMPVRPAGETDVACSVEASSDSFSGRVEAVWFARDDIDRFLSELRRLEEKRQGSANLLNMSSQSEYNPFRFEIFAIDEIGHCAVSADLLKARYVGGALRSLKVCLFFPLDAGDLPSILIEFRKLFRQRLEGV
jgi:hypothetical protein